MANPLFGPLISVVPSDEQKDKARAKAAAAALAVVGVARAAPQTLGPIARYGFGVEVGSAGGVALTPLAATNLLPQPFGFLPPADVGLKPNFYLPSGSYVDSLPGFIPGVPEGQAAEAARRSMAAMKGPAGTPRPFINLTNFGDDSLRAQRAVAAGPFGPAEFVNPAEVIAQIDAELAARQRQYEASNEEIRRRLAAVAAAAAGSDTVVVNPQSPSGTASVNQPSLILPGTQASVPQSTQPPGPPSPPSGFVEVPNNSTFGSVLGGPDVPSAAETTGKKERAKPDNDNFNNHWWAIVAGDP